MSRIIKFRAWDKKRKLMLSVVRIQWDVFQSEIIGVECVNWDNEEYDKLLFYDIYDAEEDQKEPEYNLNDLEIREFTGLHDKNGTEIYEGDIIKIESRIRYVEGSELVYTNAKVIWNNEMSRYEYVYDKTNQIPLFAVTKYKQSEVIGNIYETPELLEASE